MDLGLVVPTPSNAQDWASTKQFLVNVLSSMDIGGPLASVQVGIVLYRGTSLTQMHFGQYTAKADIIAAINNMSQIPTSGNDVATAMSLLLNDVFASGTRQYTQGVAVIMVDQSLANSSVITQLSQQYFNMGIQTLALGLTSSVQTADVSAIASNTDNNAIYYGYYDLVNRVSQTVALLCLVRPKSECTKANIGTDARWPV